MQQIYRRTAMPKCDFNKVALQLYWNHTSAWSSVYLLHIFRTTFPKNTSGGVLLAILTEYSLAEMYSNLSRTSTMSLFAEMINEWKPLTIFAKSYIVDVQVDSAYASDVKYLIYYWMISIGIWIVLL